MELLFTEIAWRRDIGILLQLDTGRQNIPYVLPLEIKNRRPSVTGKRREDGVSPLIDSKQQRHFKTSVSHHVMEQVTIMFL